MNAYITGIQALLQPMANAEKALGAAAYMKNQFAFLGIKMPERRKVCKAYMRQHPVTNENDLALIVKELWSLQEREYQYFAVELMAFYKKIWTEAIIELFEFSIVHKSWWDTVDFIANECTGHYFMLYKANSKNITNRWNRSDNIWLQRSSLLFQKNYKQQTDKVLMAKYIQHLAASKEFFVQKAIGWVLREYAKTDAAWVKAFVENNRLPPLSKREALKHIG